jgi:hypothetical protein
VRSLGLPLWRQDEHFHVAGDWPSPEIDFEEDELAPVGVRLDAAIDGVGAVALRTGLVDREEVLGDQAGAEPVVLFYVRPDSNEIRVPYSLSAPSP